MRGEPKFECRHCGKRVKKKESLENHERIHTGESPFKCADCASTFRSRPALYLHRRSPHAKEDAQSKLMAKRPKQAAAEKAAASAPAADPAAAAG